jgi:hypothetical protein
LPLSPVAAYRRPLDAIATVPPLWLMGPVWLISMILRRSVRIAFAPAAGCGLQLARRQEGSDACTKHLVRRLIGEGSASSR